MADIAKELFSKQAGAQNGTQEHKDKLAHKKRLEKEVHDARKQAEREKKDESKSKAEAAKALLKEERMLHDTKRAHVDARHQAKKEEHKQTGQMCEHGVWRCKICFPHSNHKG